jgi:S-DNA-T family DNA segregation ATPase FtsK/SpoIIIE
MTDHVGVDMVLGTGSHSRGLKAELFKDSEKGMGFLLGVTNDDLVGRSYYLDGPAAERIIARAHAAREADHRLTGHALTVDADRQEEKAHGTDLLADLERVMVDQGVTWMWNVTACGALDVLNPGAYSGLTPETIGVMLAKRGVPTRQLNRVDPNDPPGSKRQNLTGFELDDVRTARAGRRAA